MNNMKEVRIIQSKTEPNKNHLWLSDEGLKQLKGNGWEQVLSNDNGGSGSGSIDPNDENYVEYIDIKQNALLLEALPMSLMLLKIKLPQQINGLGEVGDIVVLPYTAIMLFNIELGSILDMDHLHCKFYPNVKISINNEWISPKEQLIKMGFNWDTLPKITKEQFYNLNE